MEGLLLWLDEHFEKLDMHPVMVTTPDLLGSL